MKIISINHVPEGGLSFNWLEDGILCARLASQLVIDIEAAKEAINSRNKFAGRKSYPFLLEASDVKLINSEARSYLTSEAGTSGIFANAIMTGSFISKLVNNVFLAFNKSQVPTRMFTDRREAKKWLLRVCESQLQQVPLRYAEADNREQFSYA